MKCPSLTLIVLVLKSILSNMNTVTSAFDLFLWVMINWKLNLAILRQALYSEMLRTSHYITTGSA